MSLSWWIYRLKRKKWFKNEKARKPLLSDDKSSKGLVESNSEKHTLLGEFHDQERLKSYESPSLYKSNAINESFGTHNSQNNERISVDESVVKDTVPLSLGDVGLINDAVSVDTHQNNERLSGEESEIKNDVPLSVDESEVKDTVPLSLGDVGLINDAVSVDTRQNNERLSGEESEIKNDVPLSVDVSEVEDTVPLSLGDVGLINDAVSVDTRQNNERLSGEESEIKNDVPLSVGESEVKVSVGDQHLLQKNIQRLSVDGSEAENNEPLAVPKTKEPLYDDGQKLVVSNNDIQLLCTEQEDLKSDGPQSPVELEIEEPKNGEPELVETVNDQRLVESINGGLQSQYEQGQAMMDNRDDILENNDQRPYNDDSIESNHHFISASLSMNVENPNDFEGVNEGDERFQVQKQEMWHIWLTRYQVLQRMYKRAEGLSEFYYLR